MLATDVVVAVTGGVLMSKPSRHIVVIVGADAGNEGVKQAVGVGKWGHNLR